MISSTFSLIHFAILRGVIIIRLRYSTTSFSMHFPVCTDAFHLGPSGVNGTVVVRLSLLGGLRLAGMQ